jgi:hypothetical protein
MDAIAAAGEEYPSNAGSVSASAVHEEIVGDVKRPLIILLGAVCFVLLFACANVANLLLTRAASRQREMAIRAALGAGRRRLLRQMLTESLLLGLIGGAAGLLVAAWCTELLQTLAPAGPPRLPTLPSTGRVGMPSAIPVTGLLFGTFRRPRRAATRRHLKEGGRPIGRVGGRRPAPCWRRRTGGRPRPLIGAGLLCSAIALNCQDPAPPGPACGPPPDLLMRSTRRRARAAFYEH